MELMYKIAIIVLAGVCVNALNEKDIMQRMSITAAKKIYECRSVINFTEAMGNAFINFWNVSQELTDRDFGCTVLCAIVRLQLVDHEGRLQDTNTQQFLMAHGADEAMITKLLQRSRECRVAILLQHIKDICQIGLELAVCFRVGIDELGWVPDTKDLVQKILPMRRNSEDIDGILQGKNLLSYFQPNLYSNLSSNWFNNVSETSLMSDDTLQKVSEFANIVNSTSYSTLRYKLDEISVPVVYDLVTSRDADVNVTENKNGQAIIRKLAKPTSTDVKISRDKTNSSNFNITDNNNSLSIVEKSIDTIVIPIA